MTAVHNDPQELQSVSSPYLTENKLVMNRQQRRGNYQSTILSLKMQVLNIGSVKQLIDQMLTWDTHKIQHNTSSKLPRVFSRV
jgi:hypothetical protein